jgi:hypothetical protein
MSSAWPFINGYFGWHCSQRHALDFIPQKLADLDRIGCSTFPQIVTDTPKAYAARYVSIFANASHKHVGLSSAVAWHGILLGSKVIDQGHAWGLLKG